MHSRLTQAFLGTSLLALLACNGGGDSKAPTTFTGGGEIVSSVAPIFDPTTGNVPLPNILVTASVTGITYTATATPAAGMLNINPGYPLAPDKALAFVNLKEMGNTHAVSGLNAPIYISFPGALDTTTVNGSNIKIFQLTPDSAGTENLALGFTDISSLFTFSTMSLVPSGMGVYASPKLPLLPGTRYLYVVTNRVKDAAGLAVTGSPYFEALKGTTALTGSFAALEAVRANVTSGSNILLSGYAKVMDDLITASATTTVTKRANIAVMGRFITTGAGYIPTDPLNATPALAAVRIPLEMALWAWANNAPGPNTVDFSTLESRQWSNATSAFTVLASEVAVPGSVAALFTAAGAGAAPSSAIGLISTGTIESANLQLDPYGVNANPSISGNLSAATGLIYNPGTSVLPGTGVTQAARNPGGKLRGFYHTTRTLPYLILAPKAAPLSGTTYPVAIFLHGIGGQKEQVLGLANTLCSAGYAVIAVDQARHGEIADGRVAAEWASNFFMLPSILTARTNVQTSAFNLWRLERTLKQPTADPTSIQTAMAAVGKPLSAAGATQYVGQSLGSITGAYFLAGNSIQTGGSNMKGLLSVPGSRLAFILKDSPAFGPTINAGLTAAGVTTNSNAFYQFFALAQAVADPIDPATMGTPLPGSATSRLAGRLLVQEAVGDTVIPNASGQYFVNAIAGRAPQLGADISGGFTQVLRAGQSAAAVPYVYGASYTTIKAPVAAAASLLVTTPTQGVMQYGTTAAPAAHGLLLSDTATPTNVTAAQNQLAIWVLSGLVADGASFLGLPTLAPTGTFPPLFGPESLVIHYPLPQ